MADIIELSNQVKNMAVDVDSGLDKENIVLESKIKSPKGADVNNEENPTSIYKSIESKDWDSVLKHVQASPADVSKWIVQKDDSDAVIMRCLPIHAAVDCDAPINIVQELLSIFPEGVEGKDAAGNTPLDVAFKVGSSEEVIEELMHVASDGVLAKVAKSPEKTRSKNVLGMFTGTAAAAPEPTTVKSEKKGNSFTSWASYSVNKGKMSEKAKLQKEYEAKLLSMDEEHKAKMIEMKKISADEVTAALNRTAELEILIEQEKVESDNMMSQFREQVEQVENAKDIMMSSEKNSADVTAALDTEIGGLQDLFTGIESTAQKYKHKIGELEQALITNKIEANKRTIARESLKLECGALRSTVDTATALNVKLQAEMKELLDAVKYLTANLSITSVETAGLVKSCEKQKSDLQASLEKSNNMLETVMKQARESRTKSDVQNDFISGEFSKQQSYLEETTKEFTEALFNLQPLVAKLKIGQEGVSTSAHEQIQIGTSTDVVESFRVERPTAEEAI